MKDAPRNDYLLMLCRKAQPKLTDIIYLLQKDAHLSHEETELFQSALRTKDALDHIIRNRFKGDSTE